MSALDQSLDEIISSKPKRQFKKKIVAGKAKVGKAVGKPAKKGAVRPAKAPAASNIVLDASYATKVVVYGLPRDIKTDAIKDFFASQVGGVQSVALSYNEKGQSKGIATVSFTSSANAHNAVKKYNGAPIDNGKTKLKLELVIDPTKKPLASRILANAVNANKPKKAAATAAGKKTAKKATPTGPKSDSKAGSARKSKKPAKKTIEQLDQEMADYFEKKD